MRILYGSELFFMGSTFFTAIKKLLSYKEHPGLKRRGLYFQSILYFFRLHFFGFLTVAFAFAPVIISSNSNHNLPQQRALRQESELNYVQEVLIHGVTLVLEKDLSAVRKVGHISLHEDLDKDEDDFIDLIEEAF